jgi:hypothetical protein
MLASSVFLNYYKLVKSQEFKVKVINLNDVSDALEDMMNSEYFIFNNSDKNKIQTTNLVRCSMKLNKMNTMRLTKETIKLDLIDKTLNSQKTLTSRALYYFFN